MKYVIIDNGSKEQGFPKLMADSVGRVVLFKKWNVGTIIASKEITDIGNCYTNFSMEAFHDFDGQITLSNSEIE